MLGYFAPMNILISCPLRCKRWLASLLLILFSWHAFAQESCDCPSIAQCSPCQDGITTLTLKYSGSQSVTINISIEDQQAVAFNGAVDPGDTIVISGSGSNGKFVGNRLTIRENGVLNTTIDVSCDQPTYVKAIVGNFIVLAGRSKTGGGLCCDPSTVERNPPVISNCPSDIWQELPDGSCSSAINWIEPTATDNCEVLSFTGSHHPEYLFSSGTTKVTYTAIDKFGTATTCSFNVILNEGTEPVLEDCPTDITASVNSGCQAQVSWQPPVATDNCSIASLVSSHKPGDFFPLGTTVVTYTATDASGNTASCQFSVIVTDGSPPVLTDCPQDISTLVGSTGEGTAYWSLPNASDACSEVTLGSTHEPGESFPVGTTDVIYTASDINGNISTCSFEVNVVYGELNFDFQRIVTPDGDGVNDKWLLLNIERFGDNNVTIVDRWGGVIFTGTGYDNENVVWKGQNTSGTVVPSGTYFYAIKVKTGTGIVEKRGFIELIRSR